MVYSLDDSVMIQILLSREKTPAGMWYTEKSRPPPWSAISLLSWSCSQQSPQSPRRWRAMQERIKVKNGWCSQDASNMRDVWTNWPGWKANDKVTIIKKWKMWKMVCNSLSHTSRCSASVRGWFHAWWNAWKAQAWVKPVLCNLKSIPTLKYCKSEATPIYLL